MTNRWLPADDVVLTEGCSGTMLIDGNGTVVRLNDSAAAALTLLRTGSSEEDVVQQLAEQVQCSAASARAALHNCLSALADRGLLQRPAP